MKKISILSLMVAATLAAGCAGTGSKGAAMDSEKHVLCGGPVTGTTIAHLPQAVKDTLQQRVPHAQISDIDKTTRNGEVMYEIAFAQPGRNPRISLTADGRVEAESEWQKFEAALRLQKFEAALLK